MPVTSVTISPVGEYDDHFRIAWQPDVQALTGECYVALRPEYLSDPAKRLTKTQPGPDFNFQQDIPAIPYGDLPIAPGTKFYAQAMCDGVLSIIRECSTTGSRIAPPDNFQAAAVTL